MFLKGGETMEKVILTVMVGVAMFLATATPALAGSLLLGREQTIPSDGSGTLEKVCISTTEHGDAVTHANAGGLSTSTSEDCF